MGIPCSKLVKPWPCLLCSSASTRLGTTRTAGVTFYAINVIMELPALSYLVFFVRSLWRHLILSTPLALQRPPPPLAMPLQIEASSQLEHTASETPPMFTGKSPKSARVLVLWRYWRVRAAIASFCSAGSRTLVAHNRVRWTVGMHRELVRTFFPYPIVHPSPCILASSS